MIRAAEAVSALYGAFRLARFDRSGLAYFDASVDGFWKSFAAAVIVAPLYLVMALLRPDETGGDLLVDALAYTVNWFAFPVAMLSLVQVLDKQRYYIRHIVAYNWAGVLQNAIYLPLGILLQQNILPIQPGALLSLMVLAWTLIYSGFVTQVALEVPVHVAAGLVVVDLLLSLVVNGLAAAATH